jgi:hypothetical protein
MIDLRNPWGYDGAAAETKFGDPNDGFITVSWPEFSRWMIGHWHERV